jgi:T-complex protein 1 subunit gamma
MLVLNNNTKREQGRKAQLANIEAAHAVADIIRTTLGPQSMLKMILDPMGGIVMTNDGNAILREIDVSHPAAKSMIELSRTQDEEVGDGTTSVIILAGQLLRNSVPFLEEKLHPRILVGALIKALEVAEASLERQAITVDLTDDVQMLRVVKSTLGTKFVSQFGDQIAQMAIDAVRMVVDEDILDSKKKIIDIKRYVRVEKVPGGFLEDSLVLNGVMLNKDVTDANMARRIENPRILLLDTPLEYKKGESQTNIEISNEADWEAILKQEEAYIEAMCAEIIKHRPNLVFTEKGCSDLAQHFLGREGISVIRRVRKTDNDRIARAVGASICHDVETIREEDIGTGCGLFNINKLGDEYFTYLVDCKAPKACTVILRGASKDVLSEMERNLRDAMMVVKNIILNPKMVPGGGAAEMNVARDITAAAATVSGVEQWPFRAVADGMEIIPKTLIENCGGSAIRLLTKLRAAHAESKGPSNMGIDGINGTVADMVEIGVLDPVAVKLQTLKTAVESACMLLRIDDVVSGMADSHEKSKQSTNFEDNEAMEGFGDARDG